MPSNSLADRKLHFCDFNNHSTVRGYNSDNTAGSELTNWVETNNLHFDQDGKQPGAFRSGTNSVEAHYQYESTQH